MRGCLRASLSHHSSSSFSAKAGRGPSERLLQSDLDGFCTQKQGEKSRVTAIGYDLTSVQITGVIFSCKDARMQLLSKMRSTT